MWTLPSSEAELKELLAKERQRGYSVGYQAGKKKHDDDILQCAKLAQRSDFIDAVFLSALPECMSQNAQGGDKNLDQHKRRIAAAWWYAREAWKQRGNY